MTSDRQYAEACIPPQAVVLGARLRPYCIGHKLLLQRIGSPFAIGGQPTLDDLALAVWICAHSYQEARAAVDRGMTWCERIWLLLAKVRLAGKPSEAIRRILLFRDYIAAAESETPSIWAKDDSSRVSNVPTALVLKRSLMKLGYSEQDALSIPMQQARWEHFSALELEGACDFMAADDIEGQKALEEMVAKEMAN